MFNPCNGAAEGHELGPGVWMVSLLVLTPNEPGIGSSNGQKLPHVTVNLDLLLLFADNTYPEP